MHWLARWEWDYKVQRKQYAWDDAVLHPPSRICGKPRAGSDFSCLTSLGLRAQVFLTEQALGWAPGIWSGVAPALQQELVEAKLWEPDNLAQFYKDVRRGCAACRPHTFACQGGYAMSQSSVWVLLHGMDVILALQ